MFWQKVTHSIGDYKNAKTHRQCMSLTENTEFLFFSLFFFLNSLLSGLAQLQKSSSPDGEQDL